MNECMLICLIEGRKTAPPSLSLSLSLFLGDPPLLITLIEMYITLHYITLHYVESTFCILLSLKVAQIEQTIHCIGHPVAV
jgi:hypothetical protein